MALLDVHINNNFGPRLSIAYHDLEYGIILDGAGWDNWCAVEPPVGVCIPGAVDTFANSHNTTCRFSVINNHHDSYVAHVIECTIGDPRLRVVDGCYSLPPRLARFRLDDFASGILTIIGFIIAMPSILFGAYHWYCGRQEPKPREGQASPLNRIGEGDRGSGGVTSEYLSY